MSDGGTARVSQTMITNNSVEGLYTSGSPYISWGNNRLAGNAADGAFTSTTPLQ